MRSGCDTTPPCALKTIADLFLEQTANSPNPKPHEKSKPLTGACYCRHYQTILTHQSHGSPVITLNSHHQVIRQLRVIHGHFQGHQLSSPSGSSVTSHEHIHQGAWFGYPVRRRSQSSWSSTSCCHHPGLDTVRADATALGAVRTAGPKIDTYGPSSRAESNLNLEGYEPNPAATRPHCGLSTFISVQSSSVTPAVRWASVWQ